MGRISVRCVPTPIFMTVRVQVIFRLRFGYCLYFFWEHGKEDT